MENDVNQYSKDGKVEYFLPIFLRNGHYGITLSIAAIPTIGGRCGPVFSHLPLMWKIQGSSRVDTCPGLRQAEFYRLGPRWEL